MELSWIQRHILLVLIRTSAARAKDLLPPDIPANQFVYHLEGLIARKYVYKLSRGTYALTPKGETLAGTFGTALNKQVENIKTVVMLYGKIDQRYLLFRWSRQPYLGFVTLPHERLGLGITLEKGIVSALDNKLGARRPVSFKTSVLIKIIHSGELVSHLNAFVFEVSLEGMQFPSDMRNGQVLVGVPNETNKVMDGVETFLLKLETATGPFDSEWRY